MKKQILTAVVTICLMFLSVISVFGQDDASSRKVYLPLVASVANGNQEDERSDPPVGVAGPNLLSSTEFSEMVEEVVTISTTDEDGQIVTASSIRPVIRYTTINKAVIAVSPHGSEASAAGVDEQIGNITITLVRNIGISGYDEFNHYAQAGSRTESSQCIDRLWVEAKHKYLGSNGAVYWTGASNSGYSWSLTCHNNTGNNWTSWFLFADGTRHIPVTKHSAKVNGSWTNWYGPGDNGIEGSIVVGR